MVPFQGIRAKARLPAEAKGNPADDTVAEQLPESLEEAISAYHADQGNLSFFLNRPATSMLRNPVPVFSTWTDALSISSELQTMHSVLLIRKFGWDQSIMVDCLDKKSKFLAHRQAPDWKEY